MAKKSSTPSGVAPGNLNNGTAETKVLKADEVETQMERAATAMEEKKVPVLSSQEASKQMGKTVGGEKDQSDTLSREEIQVKMDEAAKKFK